MFEIDNTVAPSAKELGLVESSFALAQGPADEHGRTDPVNATVIPLRFQAEQVRHSKDAAFNVVG